MTGEDHHGYLGIPGARTRLVETSSRRVAFIEAGSGPPLILLHATGGDADAFVV